MRNEEPFVTYDYEIEKLKRYLKPVRTAFGVSGKELADIIGISRITYMKYENGKKEISPIMYLAIRGALHDIADRIEDYDYYEILWFFFIEGMYAIKRSPEDSAEVVFVPNNTVTKDIEKCILDYTRQHKCKPMWEIGDDLKKIIKDKWPEIFN